MRSPLFVLALLASILTPLAAAANAKIGYIDSEAIREALPEFKAAQRQLERLKQEREKEISERESKLAKLQEDFRKQELLMSDARKAEMQAEFEQKVRELQEFQQRTFSPGGELFQKNIELSGPIFEKIQKALDEMAKAEGYDFIFDVAAQGGGIVYVDTEKNYNLTDKLLERLKEGTGTAQGGQAN